MRRQSPETQSKSATGGAQGRERARARAENGPQPADPPPPVPSLPGNRHQGAIPLAELAHSIPCFRAIQEEMSRGRGTPRPDRRTNRGTPQGGCGGPRVSSGLGGEAACEAAIGRDSARYA